MPRIKLPLLLRTVAALAAMGLLPLAVTYYQLRTNKDALADQVQRTHIVASLAAAAQVDTYLEGLTTLARSTAQHPVLLADPRSVTAQELLRGTLQAQASVVWAGIYNPAGEEVVLVRRSDMKDELTGIDPTGGEGAMTIARGATRRWLRLRTALPRDAGELILLADAEVLNEKVQAFQIGEQALLVLAGHDDDSVFGGAKSLEAFPTGLVERARAGKLSSGSSETSDSRIGNVIVGHAQLASAPFFVLSRQPASVARVAQERIRRATWISALGAVLLTAALSSGAYLTVVRPIRRLAAAQSQLIGEEVKSGGSEIDQLEASFELLQQRIHDAEDLGKVFLGRYQVTRLLGSGAMGSVFQGWDPKLKRGLALKTMRINAEDIDKQKLITSLMDEAAISARFHHPNIVTVYDVADEGNAAFIAMELVDGTNLEKYLSKWGPLAPSEVVPLGASIADALATAHDHGLVHHDVKPANVLLGRNRSIKVTDFGISELISAATRSDDVICGTPGYIAPECFLGEAYTPSSDLFALGLILYEALAGKNPFHGRSLRETILNTATVDPVSLDELRDDVEPELVSLIESLMAKEPRDRPSNAARIAQTLSAMAQAQSLTWAPSGLDEAKTGTSRSPTRLITLSENR